MFNSNDKRIELFFFSNRGELRIIGAISIDLNGISDEDVPKALDEEEQTKVSVSIKNLHKCNVFERHRYMASNIC